MSQPTFNLVDEPWLPVTTREGTRVEVGIAELLARAPQLLRLDVETPDVLAGLWKMLLAILHRAYDGPRDLSAWKSIWTSGAFDQQKIAAYLGDWRTRFDLWHPEHPFLQDASIEGEARSVSRLFVERAKGNNATLFDHTLDEETSVLSANVAARRLVGAQHFALGGRIEGAAASAVGNPNATAALVVLEGSSLFESLCLNLCVYDATHPIPSSKRDAPSWEVSTSDTAARAEHGYLDLITWRPRRYRLVPAEPSGRTVRGVIAAGEANRFEDHESFRNPLCGYRVSQTQGFIEIRIDPERAVWRDSAALFSGGDVDARPPEPLRQAASLVVAGTLPRSARFNLLAAGFSTDKAKVKLARTESFVVPATLLMNRLALNHLREALSLADELCSALRSAIFIAARRALSAGERSPDRGETSALAGATGAEMTYWGNLGSHFEHFLIELSDDVARAEAGWHAAMRESVFEGFRRAERKFGTSPRGLRAVVDARRHLMRSLSERLPTPNQEPHHELAETPH